VDPSEWWCLLGGGDGGCSVSDDGGLVRRGVESAMNREK